MNSGSRFPQSWRAQSRQQGPARDNLAQPSKQTAQHLSRQVTQEAQLPLKLGVPSYLQLLSEQQRQRLEDETQGGTEDMEQKQNHLY